MVPVRTALLGRRGLGGPSRLAHRRRPLRRRRRARPRLLRRHGPVAGNDADARARPVGQPPGARARHPARHPRRLQSTAERGADAGPRHDPDAAALHLSPAGDRTPWLRPCDRPGGHRRRRDPSRPAPHGPRHPAYAAQFPRARAGERHHILRPLRPHPPALRHAEHHGGREPDADDGVRHGGDRRHRRFRGLGATIYDAVRTLDIGKSIDGGIAIVILTMVLDRVTEGAVQKQKRAVA